MRTAELLVGFESALAFWRASRAGELDLDEMHVYGRARWSSQEIVERTLQACHIDEPLDVVVGTRESRRFRKGVRNHVWHGPDVSVAHLDRINGVEVCSVPAVLLQLASTKLDDLDILAIAYELTGSYGLTPWSEYSCIYGTEPITTTEELAGYAMAARAIGSRGAARVLRLLPFVRERSASPRETDLAVLFALPRVRGGFGIGGFELNKEVELLGRSSALLGRSSIRADFLWRGRGRNRDVMAEYESNEWHLTNRAIDRDSRRRMALASSDFTVHCITNEQLLDSDHLLTLAEEIASELGIRRRAPSRRMLRAYANVHDRIAFGSGIGLKEGRSREFR